MTPVVVLPLRNMTAIDATGAAGEPGLCGPSPAGRQAAAAADASVGIREPRRGKETSCRPSRRRSIERRKSLRDAGEEVRLATQGLTRDGPSRRAIVPEST